MNFRRTGSLVLLVLISINYVSNAASGPISPEVSPTPAATPSVEPTVTETDERCSTSNPRTCHDFKNLTACLINTSSSNAFKDLSLVVQNDGDEPLKVNAVIVYINAKLPQILLSKHQAKKIKILANIEGSPFIILNAGEGKCIIRVGSMELDTAAHKQYVAYLSPVYGAYFLFFATVIVGGAWACCKLGKNKQEVGGIRYQELEMEQPTAPSGENDEEMAAGWNEDWNSNWEEEHEEKLPNEKRTDNVSANGHTDPDRWENDWRD